MSGEPHAIFRVYVIQNPSGKYYIGLTEKIETRLKQHNDGLSKWTAKQSRPWKIVRTSNQMSLTEARKLENLLKRQKGGVGFFKITGLVRDQAHNPAERDPEFKS